MGTLEGLIRPCILMQVHIAVELAVEHKREQNELWEKVGRDEYMAYAVQETYQTLEPMLLSVLNEAGHRW